MHDKREKIGPTRGRNQGLDWKSNGEGEEVEGKVFGEVKRQFLLREIGEKWKKNCAEAIYKKTQLNGSRAIQNLLSTNSW